MSIASVLGFRGRTETRQDERNRILLQAKMLSGGHPTAIYLLDLSRRGALGHAEDPPQPSEIVWVVCKGSEVLARTAWVRGNRFGLAFDTYLPAAKFDILLKEGRRGLSAGMPGIALSPAA